MESTLKGMTTERSVNKTISRKNMVVELLNSIESGDKKAVKYIDATKFIQHNLTAEDGVIGFGKMLSELREYKDAAMVNIVRIIEDGDFVAAHSEYNLFGPKVGFDIFRFEGDKIVEHWDNLQQLPEQPNPSGRTMIDGTQEVNRESPTEKNRAVIKQFADEVLVGGNFSALGNFFLGDKYIQHNPAIGDSLTAFNAALRGMEYEGIVMRFDKIHKIICENDFALVVSQGIFGKNGGAPTSFYDLFRVEDQKIVEHWDVVETILNRELHQNRNGKFGFR
ncbi:MAG: nuclear transport factor 2 family protein [Rikenellaceae bacterium]